MNNIASVWKRLLAGMINSGICFLLILIFVYEFSKSSDLTIAAGQFILYLAILVFAYPTVISFFDAFLISVFGGDLGKLLTGIGIVSPDGKKIAFMCRLPSPREFANQICVVEVKQS